MKKKWFSAALSIIVFTISLYGCQSDKNSLQIKESPAEKTVLTLFMPFDGKGSISSNIYKNVIADYNLKNDDVEIRVDSISTADGFNQALLQRLETGGDGADIFIVNADVVKQINAGGYFYDLSGLSAYQLLSRSAMEQSTVDGRVYTIPLQMTAYGLFVNTGLLSQYGLAPPQNLEEFQRCCKILKENGVRPLSLNRGFSMTCMAMSRGLYPIYQSRNRDDIIFGLNNGSINISEYMLEGFRFFDELVDNGYYGDGITAEYTVSIPANTTDLEDFLSEKTAFAVFTTGTAPIISKMAPDLEFIHQGFPVLPDGCVSMPAIAARICVNAKGEHVQEALAAVEYLTSVRAEEFITENSGIISPIQSGNAPSVDSRIGPIYQTVLSPGQIPIEDMSLYFTYWDTTRDLCLKIVGGMSPEDAAKEYDRIQIEQIEAYSSN